MAGAPSILPTGSGRHGKYDVIVENIGGLTSEGPVTVQDVLPSGLIATRALAEPEEGVNGGRPSCLGEGTREVSCTYPEPVVPSGFMVLVVEFEVTAGTTSLRNKVSVSGGGASTVMSEDERIQPEGAEQSKTAGIESFAFAPTGPNGESVLQAGAHPHFLTTTLLLKNVYHEGSTEPVQPVESTKNLVFYLPLGMLGNPTVADTCPASIVETSQGATGCPPGSKVGTILPMILSNVFANTPDATHAHGVYSVAPEKGYAAEFAFTSNNITFFLYANVVRRDGTYMIRLSVPGVPLVSALVGFVATFYGDIQEKYISGFQEFTYDRGSFLTDPVDCQENLAAREASVALDTWEHPDAALTIGATTPAFSTLQGCDRLSISAGLKVTPETTQAEAPSGYETELEVPQAPNSASGLGTPPAKDVSVTLPLGTTISPAAANGLQACPQTGPSGIDIEGPESEEITADGLARPGAGHCPLASRIATIKASTPLLHEELTGHLFLATPGCGGEGQSACTMADAENGNLVGIYLELEAPHADVIVKLKGSATIRQGSGQITVKFDENPQFPLERLVVSTKQGAHAPLANSPVCGAATSNALVTPWSTPATGPATAESRFNVNWYGAGGGCPASAPFAPEFAAGTTVPLAAAASPFALDLGRRDREQSIGTLSTTLPEGLLANLTKIARCPEPQASQASLTACPANSQLGTTTVAVGSGSDPYYVSGKVFFTGAYAGAPFGLSVVVPAVAGPFNLGNVLVRARLYIDPHTSRATAISDPLPQERDGVPLRLRVLKISLSNREFVLNPTNCAVKSITGTVTSTSGASAAISSPFAVQGCNLLPFKPAFSATTEAKATKANGTGVKLKITYPSGKEANIAKLVLGFPKQLPVRLETLQKACRATTFEANPGACSPESVVGNAVVHTPILTSPLTGPIYLVSYGSAKFPDAVLVLQGEGITLEVDGQSFVSHKGALTATFASVPDAPFSTFEAVLPHGPHSQFTSVKTVGRAHGSQCGQKLVVPLTLVAQNGAQIKKKVPMTIKGCPRPRRHARTSTRHPAKRRR